MIKFDEYPTGDGWTITGADTFCRCGTEIEFKAIMISGHEVRIYLYHGSHRMSQVDYTMGLMANAPVSAYELARAAYRFCEKNKAWIPEECRDVWTDAWEALGGYP